MDTEQKFPTKKEEVKMGFRVVDDQPELAGALQRAFATEMPEAVFVNVNLKESPSNNRIDRKGLDQALKLAQAEQPLILYGVESNESLTKDIRFVALMGMKNVDYVQLPVKLNKFRKAYQQLKAGEKQEDPLAQEMLKLQQLDRAVASLRHDLKPWVRQNPQQLEQWIQQARETGFTGSDEEVIEVVEKWERKTAGVFEGKFFPGVFVDVSGTLLDVDGNLNVDLKQQVEQIAAGRPVTVWTDADLSAVGPKLQQLGIFWKLVSKFELLGAEVEEAFDDLPQEEFHRLYGITVRNYHRVGSQGLKT